MRELKDPYDDQDDRFDEINESIEAEGEACEVRMHNSSVQHDGYVTAQLSEGPSFVSLSAADLRDQLPQKPRQKDFHEPRVLK